MDVCASNDERLHALAGEAMLQLIAADNKISFSQHFAEIGKQVLCLWHIDMYVCVFFLLKST